MALRGWGTAVAWAAWIGSWRVAQDCKWKKQRWLYSPDMGWASTSLPPALPVGGTYTGNLADGDGEAVRWQELRRGHSHAPLLRLPTVFLDLLWEELGQHSPQKHKDTDSRPTERHRRDTRRQCPTKTLRSL